MEPGPANQQNAERSYREAAEEFGPALVRLARVYEADPEKRRDLVQEIHLALWRSFSAFDRRCSLRTWVYRVAHNAAISYVIRQKRAKEPTRPEADPAVEFMKVFLPEVNRALFQTG